MCLRLRVCIPRAARTRTAGRASLGAGGGQAHRRSHRGPRGAPAHTGAGVRGAWHDRQLRGQRGERAALEAQPSWVLHWRRLT